MSTYTPPPQYPANTPQQLAGQLFQVPAQQAPPQPMQQPWTQPVTLSGGVVPAGQVPVMPGPVPSGFQAPPVAPPITYPQVTPSLPVQQPAPVQVQPTAPVAPAAPVPNRHILNNLVAQGHLSEQEARAYPSDEVLFYDMMQELDKRSQAPPASQTPPPAQPVPAPAGPSADEVNRQVMALQQSGAITFENGRYVSKYPDFQAVAERANQQRMAAEQNLQELANPREWLRKNGEDVFNERLQPLQKQLEDLRKQLADATPKPHEGWIQQHRAKLYLQDPATGQLTHTLSPAGTVYDTTYKAAAGRGITDPRVLHEVAATAAENMFQYVQPAPQAPTPQPQQSFWQAAGASPQPVNPGFNLPGTQLSSHQAQQYPIPLTNQRLPDFRAIGDGILNGSIPRT